MSVLPPKTITSSNLSLAWGQAFLHVYDTPDRQISPLIISIGGFTNEFPQEVDGIRRELDNVLVQTGKNKSRISALTIIPYDMWNRRGRPSIDQFSVLCTEKVAPRMKKLDSRNQYGIYFERMMAFSGTKGSSLHTSNQLSLVIKMLSKHGTRWPRHSALQMSCFDPPKDHTGQPVRGFPCLQQVSFSHDYNSNIAVNAVYPSQYIFDRAYGNYLGLCQLGTLVAHEAGLKFSRLNCFITRPSLGDITKSALTNLVAKVREHVSGTD